MTLRRIVDALHLEVKVGREKLSNEVKRGYVSDLLSDVIANSREGDMWITLQVHPNIVAVASLNSLSAVVLINGRKPADETVQKAKEEKIPILLSNLPAFELVGRLYRLGIPGVTDVEGN